MPRICLWTTLGALLALSSTAHATVPHPCPDVKKNPPCTDERAIEKRLLAPISLNFKDMPLGSALDALCEMTGINLVVDVDALKMANVSMTQPLTLKIDAPLKAALNILLRQVELRYVVKDGALQITTEEAVKDCLQLRTYPVADLVVPVGSGESQLPPFICRMPPEVGLGPRPNKTGEEALIELLTHIIEPGSWSEVGGRGVIQYFPLGLTLVINQTLDVHEQIVDLLTAVRRLQEGVDKPYRLEARLVEVNAAGLENHRAFPTATLVRGQLISVSTSRTVEVRDGCLKDFFSKASTAPDATDSPPCYINAFRPNGFFSDQAQLTGPPVTVETGTSLKVKLTSLTRGLDNPMPEQLRLDATFQANEMTEATPEGLRVVGQTYRLINHVKLGQPIRLVLARDERGGRTRWVEFTVTEVPPPREQAEQIFQGTLPPIPR